MAAINLVERSGEMEFVLWQLLLLVWSLFAAFCYKRLLQSVGETMIAAEAGATKQTNSFSKETVDAPRQP